MPGPDDKVRGTSENFRLVIGEMNVKVPQDYLDIRPKASEPSP